LKKRGNNGLIERIVENWLTKVNEKGYQVPFCQCLVSKGYKVLHLSSHGQMEQGKDIISIDEVGNPCAFQLKSGDIDGTEFRKIKGEIEELVEIPINFPGIDKGVDRRVILVTNGVITDKVRRDIDDLNLSYKKKRELPQLEVVTKMDLLKEFIDVHGEFLPTELPDFKLFLELLLSDGHELVNKNLFSKFLENVLFTAKENKLELQRKIASALLLAQYIIDPFEKAHNHVSIIEGWTSFGSYILAIAEKYKLEPQYWKQSFNLVIYKINSELDLLKTEFLSRPNFLESSWDGGLIYKSRLVIVLGWLSAFELYLKWTNPSYNLDRRIYEKISILYKENLWYWGESATPFFITISMLVRDFGETAISNAIIGQVIALLSSENKLKETNTFPVPYADPYYTSEEILSSLFDIKKIDFKSFLGSSYHIGALVDILVRRGNKTIVQYFWKDISLVRKCEFLPTPIWKMLTWQCDEGEQVEQFFDQPQSWKKLKVDASNIDYSTLPVVLVNNPFSLYFLICYPHRLGQPTIKLIDTMSTKPPILSKKDDPITSK
jgi:hypothetical protein